MDRLESALIELKALDSELPNFDKLSAEEIRIHGRAFEQKSAAWMGEYALLMIEFVEEALAQIKFEKHSAKTFLEKYGVHCECRDHSDQQHSPEGLYSP